MKKLILIIEPNGVGKYRNMHYFFRKQQTEQGKIIGLKALQNQEYWHKNTPLPTRKRLMSIQNKEQK